jgi:ZIP family zinc transporter
MTRELITVAVVSWVAGFAAFLGGAAAFLDRIPETEKKQKWVHGIVAFGGGILMAAVAFALVPPGMKALHPAMMAVLFSSGGVCFFFIDLLLSRGKGSQAQFLSMMLDFVPEAIALGAMFGHDRNGGLLLALFIAVQNLPEGFNAFRELRLLGTKPSLALRALLVVSLLGPLSAGAGYLFLQSHGAVTAGMMNFAAGGILYLVFQDIAPASRMGASRTPAFGAVLGFVVGIVGTMLLS